MWQEKEERQVNLDCRCVECAKEVSEQPAIALDISTLVLLTIAIAFGLGFLSLVLSCLQPGMRGARLWSAAMLAFGAGYTLLHLHSSTQAAAQLYAGGAAILVSVLLMHRSLNRICGSDEQLNVFGLSILGIAGVGWLYFTVAQPSEFGRMGTVWPLASVVAVRAAWDLRAHIGGNRFAAPAVAIVLLSCAVAAATVLDLSMRWPITGSELASEFGSPVVVVGWALTLAFLTVCVLWLEFSQLYATMESAGMVDVVTGLSNRPAIIAEIEVEHSRSHRTKAAFSIAIFGVDHFEQVTDTHGQYAGDAVLKWVAEVIRRNIRPYDKIGRYGGEEFLLMMPHATEKEALIIAERARQAIQKLACVVEGRQLGVTVSIGVAVGERGADLESVLFAADAAIFNARDKGRNCTVVAPLIGIDEEGQDAKA